MKKNPTSQSAFFNLRALSAFALCSIGIMLGALGFAADPPNGTLTDSSGPISYTAGPFFVANPTPILFVDQGPECDNPDQPCDDYALTVQLPSDYATTHPNAAVKVTLSWTDTGAGASDYDLYIYNGTVTNTDGSQEADYSSAGSSNPEIATISPLAGGTSQYTVKVVPYTPSGETVNVKIELLAGGSTGGTPGFGGPDPSAPGVARYQNFYAPSGSSAESGSGEFNIGYNPASGRIMTMNIGPIWRITPPELLTPAKPECCEGLWQDRTNLSTITGVDPILWTDQKTGRTFASNSTAGANALYGFSDTDGDTWVPVAASPPSGGTDHETIGSGPYPASLGALSTPANQGEAVYYCSQTWPLGPATCQRSDTLGASYGPGVFAYYGNGITQCEGLHGHVHVAPDGTAWLPVKDCAGKQGGALSTDGGTTWNEFIATGSKPQSAGADPSIGIDSNNTVYYCYVNNEPVGAGQPPEGHPRVKVGHRNANNTVTWSYDVDIGASHGIKNAVHPEAVGGSTGRAACGFIGTDVAGDYQALNFAGNWYAFVATTYNGGQTWTTVNATPNDPVQQHAGIWQQGGSHTQRNLLDFNEITIDKFGRVLYGYSDGCVSDGCIGGTAPNDFTAFMRVARQSGGKSLFSSYDTNTDTNTVLPPKPPCLSGVRDSTASYLSWRAPDNGGAEIIGYQILRGLSSGGETILVANTGSDKTTYTDTTADPTVAHYFYTVKAINAADSNGVPLRISNASNEVDLTVGPSVQPPLAYSCSGVNVVTDAAGDAINPSGAGGTTSQADITAISFSANSTTLIPKMTLANLTRIPSPTTTFTAYFTAWTSSDGKTYGIEVDVDAATILYGWGEFNPSNNQLTTYHSTTGTFTAGVNGTITVNVPLNGVGSPTIPITDVNGTPAVTNPYGVTIAGIGALGTGLVYTQPMDRAPNTGYGQKWAVCPPVNNPPTAVLTASPTSGNAPLNVNFNGSGSYDSDSGDSIASYTFKFGDGSPAVTQSTATISHTYNNPGVYAASLTVKDSHGASNVNSAEVTITVNAPDLVVSGLTASNNQAPQGAKIPLTARITNEGSVNAPTSQTAFYLDNNNAPIGVVSTPAVSAHQSVTATLNWNTAGVKKGNHTIYAVADYNNQIPETNDTNNKSGLITIYIQGNQKK
jgi:PKD repeat protein